MRRIPIRLRLTLAFAVVMAFVLVVMGFVVYNRLGASLMATVKLGSAGVRIVAAFQYVLVESSLTNILR